MTEHVKRREELISIHGVPVRDENTGSVLTRVEGDGDTLPLVDSHTFPFVFQVRRLVSSL